MRLWWVCNPPVRLGGRAARLPFLAASAFFGDKHIFRTSLYIDGFNRYYLSLRGTPYRWLDLGKLARLVLPQHDIVRIRYFTTRVVNRPGEPTKGQRQQAYLRALQTIPNLTIHYGHFLEKKMRRPLAQYPGTGPRVVEVLDTEEKGSDVNLASHLLLDGFEDEYELAVVVSNDSDLQLPITMVRDRLGKRIGVLDPSSRRSFELHNAASWYRPLHQGPLGASLFPDTLSDDRGPITKPAGW